MIDSDEKIITLIIFYFLIFRLLNPVYGASIDELWKQRESNIQWNTGKNHTWKRDDSLPFVKCQAKA